MRESSVDDLGLNVLLTHELTQSQTHIGSAGSAHGKQIQRTQLHNLQPAGGAINNPDLDVAAPPEPAAQDDEEKKQKTEGGDGEHNFWGVKVKPAKRKKGRTHKHLTIAEEQ